MTLTTKHVTPDQLTADDRKLLACIRDRFASVVGPDDGAGVPLFTTDTPDLWDTFLTMLSPDLRAIYTCNACRKFVERYGGLVSIDEAGFQRSVMWDDGPGAFRNAVRVLAERVEHARITGVFCTKDAQWGTPVTGEWQHFAVTPPKAMVWTSKTKAAHERAAELREEYGILRRSLAEYPAEIVRNAYNLLETGQLYRSEKCIGIAAWLLELHEKLAARKNRLQNEATAWFAVATAPPGFCHVRTTVISTLLDDIVARKPFTEISRAFSAKMHPTQYQRPQSDPASGNIQRAEELVASLGIASALHRRFARVEEIDAMWRTMPAAKDTRATQGGVFSHLKPRADQPHTPVEAPPTLMTWSKFASTVLTEAESIEVLVPRGARGFGAITTASDPTAPPILQWDREDRRNPFDFFMYVRGTLANRWNLIAGTFTRVTAITSLPERWFGNTQASHHAEGLFIVIEGCRDTEYTSGGALFPESMRSELHEVRATIESYSRTAVIDGRDEASACGLVLAKSVKSSWDVVLRVTTKRGRASYKLDRWD